MINEWRLSIGQTVSLYAPGWLRQDNTNTVYCIDFPVSADWSPSANYGEYERKRGDRLAITKETKTIRSFWTSRIPGSNDCRQVPNFTEPEYEILGIWKWTGRNWKAEDES